MLVFAEDGGGGEPENLEKNPRGREENQHKLNPFMASGPGIEPGPHWWETSALTTAPYQVRLHKHSVFFHVTQSIFICLTNASWSFGVETIETCVSNFLIVTRNQFSAFDLFQYVIK